MKLNSRSLRPEDADLYWTIVAATLRVVFKEEDSVRVGRYRARIESPISAYPVLIYHRSPFEVAAMLRRNREEIRDEHFNAFEDVLHEFATSKP